MASGTYTFNPGVGEIIVGAYARVQVRRTEITTGHMADARHEANLLQVQWGNKGPNLWNVENQTITLVAGQGAYDIPANTIDILDSYISIGATTQPYDASNDATTDANVIDPAKSVGIDRVVTPLGRTEFAQIPNKAVQGIPVSFWFEKAQAPKISFWPVPDRAYLFNFWRLREIQDAVPSNGGTADVPYLWMDAFTAGLAHRLSRIYKPEIEQLRKADADEAWTIAASQDIEDVPLFLTPSTGAYWS